MLLSTTVWVSINSPFSWAKLLRGLIGLRVTKVCRDGCSFATESDFEGSPPILEREESLDIDAFDKRTLLELVDIDVFWIRRG